MTAQATALGSAPAFRARRLYSALGVAVAAMAVVAVVPAVADLHAFNYAVTGRLNRMVGRSLLLDHALHDLTKESFSNAPMGALIWFAWYARDELARHARLVGGALGTVLAVLLCYKLQEVFPDHLRPLTDPGLPFRVPGSVNPSVFSRGFAFPSEHATLMFGLATTILGIDRRLGVVALLLAGCLATARVYLGFIFPTDVSSGAILGAIAALAAQMPPLRRWAERAVLWGRRRPAWFAAICFYVGFSMSRVFEDHRNVAAGIVHVIRSHGGH